MAQEVIQSSKWPPLGEWGEIEAYGDGIGSGPKL